MPLLIDFKAGEKIIINGAVIENVGPNAKLRVHNESTILRGKEVISSMEDATPARRVYFALQCAYIFPQNRDEYLEMFGRFINDYVTACPSAMAIAGKIVKEVDEGHYYSGLKATQKLLKHESDILSKVEKPAAESKKK
jgi:flagellar protein FlbT